MITRYSREIMTNIWSPENRYQKWLDVEILACEAMAKLGKIPKGALKNIKENVSIKVERIDEIENPELAMGRMQELYENKGYPKTWID